MKKIMIALFSVMVIGLGACGTTLESGVDSTKLSKVNNQVKVATNNPNENDVLEVLPVVEVKVSSISTDYTDKEEMKAETKEDKPKKQVRKEINATNHDQTFTVNTDANVRDYPDVNDGKSISVLSQGKEVKAFEKTDVNGTTWYHIQFENNKGWMSGVVLTDSAIYKKQQEELKKKQEQERVEQQKKAEQQEVASTKQSSEVQSKPKYNPNTLYFNGKAVPYKAGGEAKGQAIIDSHGGYKYASTWGDIVSFNGTDNLNTNFIGHNPGVFAGIENAKQITVTDGNGTPFTYKLQEIVKAHKDTYVDQSGVYQRDRLFGKGSSERITVQTCVLGEHNNWLMFFVPAN